jgi:hypothetical protein
MLMNNRYDKINLSFLSSDYLLFKLLFLYKVGVHMSVHMGQARVAPHDEMATCRAGYVYLICHPF